MSKDYTQAKQRITSSGYHLSGGNDKEILADMLGQTIEDMEIEDNSTIVLTLSNQTKVTIEGGSCSGYSFLWVEKD